MSTTAILFPGQGAQFVGMGKDLAEASPEARAMYERASQVLGLDLARVCFEGPEDELTRTHICQPAILVTSLAVLRVLEERHGPVEYAAAAGLSLGEHTALCFAGAMDFETAVRVVGRRGALMQEACEARPGGMSSLMGLERDPVEDVVERARGDGVLVVGNYNAPGQYVLSGSLDALERAETLAKEAGARRAIRLKVAGAYHSPLMAGATDGLRRELEAVEFRPARIPVVSNVTGRPQTEPEEIRANLIAQVQSPVRWEDSLRTLLAMGVNGAHEVGPGRVLAGLFRATERSVAVTSYCGLDTLPDA